MTEDLMPLTGPPHHRAAPWFREWIAEELEAIATLVSPEIARWLQFVEVGKPDECWPWRGGRDTNGYGLKTDTSDRCRRRMGGHRWTYELFFGPLPDELHVLHSCDNPPCCNPVHLSPGTQTENMRDAAAKGRFSGPKPVRATCLRGHLYTSSNTYFAKDGARRCRICAAEYARAFRARRAT